MNEKLEEIHLLILFLNVNCLHLLISKVIETEVLFPLSVLKLLKKYGKYDTLDIYV